MNRMNYYPKVLIVLNGFYRNNGRDITLETLFSRWPKDRIAVANTSLSDNVKEITDKKYFLKFNLINFFEIYKKKINVKINTEISHVNNVKTSKNTKTIIQKLKKIILNRYIRNLIEFLEYTNIYKNIEIKNSFIKWVNDYNPDIIFCIPSNNYNVKFLIKLRKIVSFPFGLYFVDDWVNYNNQIVRNFFFKKLIKNENKLFCISEQLSKKYFMRYKKIFYPIHKPVEINKWKNSKSNCNIKHTCNILFFGNLQLYNIKEIKDLCDSIKMLNTDVRIQVDLYGALNNKNLIKNLNKINNINYKGRLKLDEVPSKVMQYDILFLPLSFSKKFKIHIKNAMPTKLTEYLISGVPILLYAPKYTALVNFASRYNVAQIVTENNVNTLSDSLYELICDKSLRISLTQRALKIAKNKFSVQKVQTNFINELIR